MSGRLNTMRSFLFIGLILSCNSLIAQSVPLKQAVLGKMIDKSTAGEVEYLRQMKECEAISAKIKDSSDYEELSAAEKEILENCDRFSKGYWDLFDGRCSWYCGGGLDTVSATSYDTTEYGSGAFPINMHDFSYKTAWMEGVQGPGLGESLTCHFPPHNPRVTEIIIVNGYVKSAEDWKNHSRVKKLKLYIDDKPLAILNLADSRREQHFKFAPLGYAGPSRQNMPWWTMTFEILAVYKGDKYDKTAITEIYFDGIDVH